MAETVIGTAVFDVDARLQKLEASLRRGEQMVQQSTARMSQMTAQLGAGGGGMAGGGGGMLAAAAGVVIGRSSLPPGMTAAQAQNLLQTGSAIQSQVARLALPANTSTSSDLARLQDLNRRVGLMSGDEKTNLRNAMLAGKVAPDALLEGARRLVDQKNNPAGPDTVNRVALAEAVSQRRNETQEISKQNRLLDERNKKEDAAMRSREQRSRRAMAAMVAMVAASRSMDIAGEAFGAMQGTGDYDSNFAVGMRKMEQAPWWGDIQRMGRTLSERTMQLFGREDWDWMRQMDTNTASDRIMTQSGANTRRLTREGDMLGLGGVALARRQAEAVREDRNLEVSGRRQAALAQENLSPGTRSNLEAGFSRELQQIERNFLLMIENINKAAADQVRDLKDRNDVAALRMTSSREADKLAVERTFKVDIERARKENPDLIPELERERKRRLQEIEDREPGGYQLTERSLTATGLGLRLPGNDLTVKPVSEKQGQQVINVLTDMLSAILKIRIGAATAG
jgi:hypothetical protein